MAAHDQGLHEVPVKKAGPAGDQDIDGLASSPAASAWSVSAMDPHAFTLRRAGIVARKPQAMLPLPP